MQYRGILVNQGLNNIDAFNPNSPDNRDKSLLFLSLIKEKFNKQNVLFDHPHNFVTKDKICFEIDIDAPNITVKNATYSYLIRFECEHVYPKSYKLNNLKKYIKIFSWSDKDINQKQYVEICIPNTFQTDLQKSTYTKSKLCCNISSNKSLPRHSSLDLYSQRVVTIRWFEKNAHQDFDLYGQGWDRPAAFSGTFGKVINRMHTYLPKLSNKVHFPSYRGKVVSKHETLQKYRFCICYENVKDLPGYITEKIFDCFFAGCVPIYWGAPNITDYIPEDCFIDRRKFSNHEALYQFMINMTELEFIAYQERIAAFLISDKAKPFSAEFFAETVVSTIINDLARV